MKAKTTPVIGKYGLAKLLYRNVTAKNIHQNLLEQAMRNNFFTRIC